MGAHRSSHDIVLTPGPVASATSATSATSARGIQSPPSTAAQQQQHMDTRRATMHRHPFVRSHDESHDIQPLSTGVTNAIVLDGHCPRSAQRRISGTTKLRLKLRPHFGEPIPPLEGKESLVVRAPFQFPRPDDADPDGDVLQPHRHRRSAPRCRGHRDDPGYPIHGTFPGILASRRPPPPPLDPRDRSRALGGTNLEFDAPKNDQFSTGHVLPLLIQLPVKLSRYFIH